MQTRRKSETEIAAMRKGGKVLGALLHKLEEVIKPGVTGLEVDSFAEKFIRDHGMKPGFKGYHGFPGTICFCRNEEVVHGIPSSKQIIHDGDIVTVDCGVIHNGLNTDSAVTYLVGNVDLNTQQFVRTCQKALYEGIRQIKPGRYIGDIGNAIEKKITASGYHIIKDLTGHGIGEYLHEEPHVPNYGKNGSGMALKPGFTFAIEPIVGIETGDIKTLEDGWMIVTKNSSLSCQWEHTVLITSAGVEILTLRPDESHILQ